MKRALIILFIGVQLALDVTAYKLFKEQSKYNTVIAESIQTMAGYIVYKLGEPGGM